MHIYITAYLKPSRSCASHCTALICPSTGVMAITAIAGVTYFFAQRLRGKEITWELIKRPTSEAALTKRE